MKLTPEVATAFGKAFAAFCVTRDQMLGRYQDPASYDCVAVEESDIYSGFIAEFFPSQDWEAMDADPGYQVLREVMYREAAAMTVELLIVDEKRRLEYSDADVAAMHPDLKGVELLEMLMGAEPAEDESENDQ